jgi:hypothetical protein
VSLPLQSAPSSTASFLKALFYKEKMLKPSISTEDKYNKYRVLSAD